MKKFIYRIRTDDQQLIADARKLFVGKKEWAVVGMIMLMGFVVRFIMLFRPMDYDESYTFLSYASKSFYIIISDYSFPNNHVFHSILVRLSYLLLGDDPWSIRLPAFLAGLLMIPVVYIFGRRLFNRRVGLISAGFIAFWPEFIQYSTNARGYTIVALITLLIFCLAIYLKKHPNLAGWVFLVVLSALGFFTIPVMLYPFGAVYGWLFLSGIFDDIGQSYTLQRFLKYLFSAGVGTALLSLLLYSSIISHYGLDSLIGNRFVIGYDWEAFLTALPAWLGRFLNSWFSVSPVLTFAVFVGVLLSLMNPTLQFRQKISLLLVSMLWLLAILCIQRPEIIPRTFLSFLPLFLMYSAAGWVGLLSRIISTNWRLSALSFFTLIILALPAVQAGQLAESNWGYINGEKGETEKAVLLVKKNVRADDIIVTSLADVWYYLYKDGIPKNQISDLQNQTYQRAWLVIDVPYGETVENVINTWGPVNKPIDSKRASLELKYSRLSVYLSFPKEGKN